LRAWEIVSRIVRDLDDDGQLLWIPETKTEAGKRTLPVPAFLQPYLRDIVEGKKPTDRLFGEHWSGGTGHGSGSRESAGRRRCPR
jgi:integrase